MAQPTTERTGMDSEQREALEQALRMYSTTVVERWFKPRNRGAMEKPDGLGRAASDCNDTIEVFLRVRRGHIVDISFLSTGCGSTLACASMITELAAERSLEDALLLTGQDVIHGLDGLPEHNTHCAEMAVGALQRAVQDYYRTDREPWKRMYR